LKKGSDMWCNRWLSLGGRFTLIKSVLEGQPSLLDGTGCHTSIDP
jgi:hypothetical protein